MRFKEMRRVGVWCYWFFLMPFFFFFFPETKFSMTHKNSNSLSLSTVRICEALYLASGMFDQRQPWWETKCREGAAGRCWASFLEGRRRQSWGGRCPGNGACVLPTWNGTDVPVGVSWSLPKLHAAQVIRAFLWIQWLQVLGALQNGGGNP